MSWEVDQDFPCVLAHKNCRHDFKNPLRKSSSSVQTNETNESFNLSLRSEGSNEYNWRTHCFFCGEFIAIDKKHSDRTKKLFKAGELPSIDTTLSKCKERGDTWSEEICRRISLSIDLVASNAIITNNVNQTFWQRKMFQVKDRVERRPGVHSATNIRIL